MVTNDMTPRKHEAITLGPSNKLQGTQKLFFLETGLVLKRRVHTVVSMSYRVIKKMNQWVKITKKEDYGKKLTFINCTKEIYNWDNDELWEEEGLIEK